MQVHSSIADILCAQEDLGDAAPYIPTFYQYCEPIKPCPEAEVSKTWLTLMINYWVYTK